jgi:predicted 2-oxoglutarate/Fe(II)-dependent dioxygenase YbiX
MKKLSQQRNNMYRVNEYLDDIIIRPKIFSPEECRTIYTDHDLRSGVENVSGSEAYGFAHRYPLKGNDKKTAWILNRIVQITNIINQMYYRFRLTSLKDMQLIEYKEKCFFDWHIDIAGKDSVACTRKINTVVFLSEPDDYEGGKLTFNLAKVEGMKEIEQEQGTMVFFPSYRAHRVETITKGTRYSLSTIFNGNSFS